MRKVVNFSIFYFLVVSSVIAAPIDELTPGSWYEIPNSRLDSVLPSPQPWGDPTAIMYAWSGGAYDVDRDRLIVWGGGHNDYAGNELYAFDLNNEQWVRLTNPSSSPVSVHTYDQLEYVPKPIGKFFAAGGSIYPSGNATTTTWLFNFDANLINSSAGWEQQQSIPGSFYKGITGYNMNTAYDPLSGKVLIVGNFQSGSFAPATNTWTIHGDNPEQPLEMTGALDPVRRKFVTIGAGNAFVYSVSANGTLGSRTNLTTTGNTEIQNFVAPGFDYDPVSGNLVAWGSGKDVYTLNLDNNTWTKKTGVGTVDPGNPYASIYKGTFGRFRYVPSKNIFIVVTNIAKNVFVYKLSAGAGGGQPDVLVDSDGDGLPDVWENLYFGTLSQSGAQDYDSDGITNLSEYQNGSDPTISNAEYQTIVSVEITNTSGSAQTSVPVTFGQVFKEGDVAVGSALIGRLSSGAIIPIQVDKKAAYADGSLRHAIVSAIIPSLGADGETLALGLGEGGSSSAGISLDDLVNNSNGFNANISLTVGGTPYSANLINLLQNANVTTWLSGPIVTEWIVGSPVKTGNNIEHDHLTAYFHVRAYTGLNKIRVDAVVENNWAYVNSPSNFTYDVNFSIGQSTVYSKTNLTHYHHARWHKAEWWGGTPSTYVKHDMNYLMASKALPNYNTNISPPESQLAAFYTDHIPMSKGNQRTTMSDGGIDQSIGPVAGWEAALLLSGDIRAYKATLANSDAGGSYSIHYRNDQPGKPSSGYPVMITDHPSAGSPGQSGGDFLACAGSCSVPYSADVAHQPSIAYVPYLITGDYYYLEELHFWANYIFFDAESSVNSRAQSQGLVKGHQERGQAWALRTIGRAAFITPDGHPMKSYFTTILNNNMAWYTSAYVDGTIGGYKNNLGAIDRGALGTSSGRQETKTWMDDFFTWSVGHLMELGFTNWQTMLDFKAQFVIGRLYDPAFCYIGAGKDTISLAASAQGNWFSDWATVYSTTYPVISGLACGSAEMAAEFSTRGEGTKLPGEIFGWAPLPGSRVASMHPATAILVDNGTANADAAWQNLQSSAVLPDWNDSLNGGAVYAIWPRDVLSLTFSSNTSIIAKGGSVTLTWDSPDAVSCSASGGWSGSKSTTGTQSISAINANTTFTITCTNDTYTSSKSISVAVQSNQSNSDNSAPSMPGNLKLTIKNLLEVHFTWAASTDTGGSGLAGYRVFRDGSLIGTVSGTAFKDVVLEYGDEYIYAIRAYDNAGNESASNSVLVTTAGGNVAYRINAGGGAYVDSFGRMWSADNYFNTGNTGSTSNAIIGTTEDALFQTQRWDSSAAPELTYSFAVQNGDYTVILYFAEYYGGAQANGVRTMNINIEGEVVAADLDVYREAGGNTALVKSYVTSVVDGELNIQFIHRNENTMVSAIEIMQGQPDEFINVPPGALGSNGGNNSSGDNGEGAGAFNPAMLGLLFLGWLSLVRRRNRQLLG